MHHLKSKNKLINRNVILKVRFNSEKTKRKENGNEGIKEKIVRRTGKIRKSDL